MAGKSFIVFAIFVLPAAFCAAAVGGRADEIEQLNAKVTKLQQQITEMQKKHDAEIAALRKQIDNLATVADGQKGRGA